MIGVILILIVIPVILGGFRTTRGKYDNFDVNSLVDWSGIGLPGKLISSAPENNEIAARDIPASPLSPDDFRAAEFVDEEDPIFIHDPLEKAGLFEGDIANVTMDDLRKLRSGAYSKNAIRELWKKWPDATIPYIISSQFNTYERSVIAKAMKNYREKTCIRFIPRTSETAHIHIMKGSGCSSSIGRTGSRQTVSLGTGCVYTGEISWGRENITIGGRNRNIEKNKKINNYTTIHITINNIRTNNIAINNVTNNNIKTNNITISEQKEITINTIRTNNITINNIRTNNVTINSINTINI